MNIHRRITQRGLSLIEILVSVAIVAIMLGSIYEGVAIYNDYTKGKAVASSIKPYHQAAIDYAHRYRIPLTAATGPSVTGVATALTPTVAELLSLGVLAAGYNGRVADVPGSPTISLTLIPTACTGTACDIGIAVTYPAPVVSVRNTGYRALSYAVREFGSEAGFSTPDLPGTISSIGWSRANPLGAVGGVFGTYITYTATGLAQFLTVNDVRNPNFINNVTIGGDTLIGGTLTVVNSIGSGTGTGTTGGCQLAQLANAGGAGQILARASDCVVRVFADGGTGVVETRTATGSPSVRIGGDGSLYTYSTTGRNAAGITYTASISTVYADNLRNTSGTGGINVDGGVFGTSATFSSLTVAGPSNLQGGTTLGGTTTLTQIEVAGQPCSVAGIFARQTDGQLLACVANVWRLSGLTRTTIGAPCIDGIALDIASATRTLICRNNVYISLNPALGRIALSDYQTVIDGTVVSPLPCEVGSIPIIEIVPSSFQTAAGGGTVRYSGPGVGPWTISITGVGGGEAVVARGCQYLVL